MLAYDALIIKIYLEQIIECSGHYIECLSVFDVMNNLLEFPLFFSMLGFGSYGLKQFNHIFLDILVLLDFIVLLVHDMHLRSDSGIDIIERIEIFFVINSPLLSLGQFFLFMQQLLKFPEYD